MIIRLAKESDVRSLIRLLVQLGYPNQDEDAVHENLQIHRQDGYQLLVGEVDQDVIGFVVLHWFHVFHFAGNMGRISAFCVDERFRSQGIGSLLLTAAEDRLKTEGCTKIEVTSNARRTRTHKFYLDRGYSEDSKRFVKYLLSH